MTRMGSLACRWGALVVLLCAWAAPARADFGDPDFELDDVSAWTLRSGELSFSPEAVRLGIAGALELGSYYPLDAIGAPNADLKVTIHAGPWLAVAARVGVLYFDPRFVGIDSDFEVLAVPLALEASGKPLEQVRVHGAIEFLSARPDTQAPDGALRVERHIGPVGRLALRLGGEYRFGDHFSALGQLELPLMAHRKELLYPDESDGFGAHARVEAAMQMVYAAFNLRLGVGYGPSFLGKAGVFPVFQIGVRVF